MTVAGANRILLVDSNQSGNTATSHTTAVQWDTTGTPVSLTKKGTRDSSSGFSRADLWYLLAPATGTKQITITNVNSPALQAGAASYTGVDQTTPFNAASPQTATGDASGGGRSRRSR
jgi:hypothetical protein